MPVTGQGLLFRRHWYHCRCTPDSRRLAAMPKSAAAGQQRTKPRCRKLRLPFPCGLFNHTLPRRSNRSRKCDGASPSRGRECGGVGGCRAHGSRRSRWSIQRV